MMKLPFAKGFAAQDYLVAEEGIVSAFQNNMDYWYIDASLNEDRLDQWPIDRINHLEKLINQYNILPIIHGNYKVPLASDVEHLRLASIEYVKKEIDFAKQLGAPLIIHGGAIVEPRLIKKTKKYALNQFFLSIEALLNYSEKCGVNIYIENLSNYTNYFPFHYIFTTPEEISYVLEKIPDVKIFFDVGHANIGNDPVEFFSMFHQSIVGMSFSNNNGVRDSHLGLFNGKIKYSDLVGKILKLGWRGIIALETRGVSASQSIDDLKKVYSRCIS